MMQRGRKSAVVLLCLSLLLLLCACGAGQGDSGAQPGASAAAAAEAASEKPQEKPAELEQEPEQDPGEEAEEMLCLKIGETAVAVDWEENEAVLALKELCREEKLSIALSMYGGFEQVGPIGKSLPRNDVHTTTAAGDIVLYSGNQIVIFYGSNSWSYTRLGHITDRDAAGMEALLGGGDVMIHLWTESGT